MKEILEINLRDRYAVVEPGVVNVWLTNALKGTGYHYAPDPSSQGACTIGGNVATNSGGPHTLKYGVTVNHVLGVEAVLADGASSTRRPGRRHAGLDLVGAIVGSEGTLAIVTKVWVRLTRDPQGLPHDAGRLRDGRRRHEPRSARSSARASFPRRWR
jgi:glycolate oxidase